MRGLTRRVSGGIAILLAASVAAGCNRGRFQGETIEESGSGIASVVHTADPATATQLIRGFHDIEQNAWRWTKATFSVALRPPAGASQKGAVLALRFSLPEQVIERLASVAVSAAVEGTSLPAQSFTRSGDHVYKQEVPPSALSVPIATVDFSLDKSLPAGTLDQRELGIVVNSVGFEAK
jgi:hypothetical protein